MVPQVATASFVPASPMRRTAHIRTYAKDASQRRNWVGAHRWCRRPVSEEIALAFLQPVLHLATLAVHVLIEEARRSVRGVDVRDDEARVGCALGPLGLADHAPFRAPALARAIREVGEDARPLASSFGAALALRISGASLTTRRLLPARPSTGHVGFFNLVRKIGYCTAVIVVRAFERCDKAIEGHGSSWIASIATS